MRIAKLSIKNFRGIREATIAFGRHTVLVDPNSSGKTTVIEALTMLFGRDRLIRTLTEHDFFGCDPQPTDRIQIVATVVDFEPNRCLVLVQSKKALDAPPFKASCSTNK